MDNSLSKNSLLLLSTSSPSHFSSNPPPLHSLPTNSPPLPSPPLHTPPLFNPPSNPPPREQDPPSEKEIGFDYENFEEVAQRVLNIRDKASLWALAGISTNLVSHLQSLDSISKFDDASLHLGELHVGELRFDDGGNFLREKEEHFSRNKEIVLRQEGGNLKIREYGDKDLLNKKRDDEVEEYARPIVVEMPPYAEIETKVAGHMIEEDGRPVVEEKKEEAHMGAEIFPSGSCGDSQVVSISQHGNEMIPVAEESNMAGFLVEKSQPTEEGAKVVNHALETSPTFHVSGPPDVSTIQIQNSKGAANFLHEGPMPTTHDGEGKRELQFLTKQSVIQTKEARLAREECELNNESGTNLVPSACDRWKRETLSNDFMDIISHKSSFALNKIGHLADLSNKDDEVDLQSHKGEGNSRVLGPRHMHMSQGNFKGDARLGFGQEKCELGNATLELKNNEDNKETKYEGNVVGGATFKYGDTCDENTSLILVQGKNEKSHNSLHPAGQHEETKLISQDKNEKEDGGKKLHIGSFGWNRGKNIMPISSIKPRRMTRIDEQAEQTQEASTHENIVDMNPINKNPDSIIDGFHTSSRRTLHFVAPESQNGIPIIKPKKETVVAGAKKWNTTALGYLLGKKPYFYHLQSFAKATWKGIKDIIAADNGFYLFIFDTENSMEDVIQGGPWLFNGQPLFLQKWQPGLSLERKKHRHVPVWVKLRNLPLEYWTTEGLSVVASGVGQPLYPDTVTKMCSRIDYARVCVLIDMEGSLPKEVVIVKPTIEGGVGGPCKVGVEYEWLPKKCSSCQEFGHDSIKCPKKDIDKKPSMLQIYLPKKAGLMQTHHHQVEKRNTNKFKPQKSKQQWVPRAATRPCPRPCITRPKFEEKRNNHEDHPRGTRPPTRPCSQPCSSRVCSANFPSPTRPGTRPCSRPCSPRSSKPIGSGDIVLSNSFARLEDLEENTNQITSDDKPQGPKQCSPLIYAP